MMGRWLRSRTWKKFVRHRMAVGALVIVTVYILIGLIVMAGAITVDHTRIVFGASNEPGMYRPAKPEQRVNDVIVLMDQFEFALETSDPDQAIDEISYGFRQTADLEPDEFGRIIKRCREIVDSFYEIDDLNRAPEILPEIEGLEAEADKLFEEPTGGEAFLQNLALFAGTDQLGRSVLLRAVYSIKVAMQIGVVTALISVAIGTILGAAAGFFGGWVDHLVIWAYSTISSIPNLVLLVVLAYMFQGSAVDGSLIPVYVAFCSTFWVGPCRVIRGETMKLKELEYIQAARTIGFNGFYILFRHVLPNMAHLMLINFSLLLIGAIKSEVILSFLGLGVKSGASWGLMINASKPEVINGFFWQIGTATGFMFALVLAFNILSDALQDVFDPKHN